MKAGAEPKKLAILATLLVVAGVALYMNVFSGDSPTGPAPAPRAAAVVVPTVDTPQAGAIGAPDTRRAVKNNAGTEIKFRQGSLRPEDRPDPATIDPTLRLDLLAKVQNVEMEGTMRNLFQYGAAPPPPPAAPIPLPEHPPTIAINSKPATPPPPPPPPGPPPAPKAPAMTFKYYGYKVSKADGRKEAFLLDGDDIIIAGENDAVKLGRYKVVRIGVNSITIEDTQFKSTQTLQLQEDTAA
ncbi:MAG: hypothetical protein ABSG41_15700 [Bryobacteraceae bacterium]|jgi:hypothetical protein